MTPSGPGDNRPPNQPPTSPPPKPPASLVVPGLLAEADAVLAPKTPVRQDFSLAAVGPDGPGPFFTLPATPPPPRFDAAKAEAHVLAELMAAASRPPTKPPRKPYGSQPLNPATPYRKP